MLLWPSEQAPHLLSLSFWTQFMLKFVSHVHSGIYRFFFFFTWLNPRLFTSAIPSTTFFLPWERNEIFLVCHVFITWGYRQYTGLKYRSEISSWKWASMKTHHLWWLWDWLTVEIGWHILNTRNMMVSWFVWLKGLYIFTSYAATEKGQVAAIGLIVLNSPTASFSEFFSYWKRHKFVNWLIHRWVNREACSCLRSKVIGKCLLLPDTWIPNWNIIVNFRFSII